MTDVAADSIPVHSDARARRNVAVLVFAQATLGAQLPMIFIMGGLAGQILAENKALATVPISAVVLTAMFGSPAISWLMGRVGRRPGFMLGALCGCAGALLGAYALVQGSFTLLIAGACLSGVYMAAQMYYRFAAADAASPEFRPKAISWVMAGGLLGAILGPELVILTRDMMAPTPFAGAYVAAAGLNLVGVWAFLFLDAPKPAPRDPDAPSGRPMSEILRQPRVIVAIICAMIGYALMNLVMTSTPLAIVACGYSPDDAAGVVRAHVLAMFAPSFFTGHLIARFGAPWIIAVGLALLAACGAVALSGVDIAQFYVALILLGFGWNFSFIGATAMLAASHAPEERAKVQGLNDFLVFGLVAAASFSSGALMNGLGWDAVNMAIAPFIAAAGMALIWLALRRGAQA